MIINICDIIYLEVMKMLKTKEVILKVSPRSKRYYQEKGYDISKGTILVKIEDLQPTSKENVRIKKNRTYGGTSLQETDVQQTRVE